MPTIKTIKKIAITGAGGLIGSALVRKLLAEDMEVIGYDRVFSGEWVGKQDKLVWETVDVSHPSFGAKLSQHKPDMVVHCAAHPGGRSLREPLSDVNTNVSGSMQVFEWCARSKVPVIYLSSSVIYGDQPSGPISETASVNPGTIYGVCKVACENFLTILEKGYGLSWTVLRLFATYGAGHKPSTTQGIVNVMLTQLMEGNNLLVKGSLERSRDMLYVDDAVDAIFKCILTQSSRSQIINIGTGNSVTIKTLIHNLSKILGKHFSDIQITEEKGTVGDPFYNSADCSKAKSLLGFTPQHNLNSGLQKIINLRNQDVSKNLDHYQNKSGI